MISYRLLDYYYPTINDPYKLLANLLSLTDLVWTDRQGFSKF